MSTKTVAQLKAELAEAKAEAEALRAAQAARSSRPPRDRFQFQVWANNQRSNDNSPAWRGAGRMVLDKDVKAGEPLWIDFSEWPFDPARYPGQFEDEDKRPVMTASLSLCPPARARELEHKREVAMAERGQPV